VSYLLSQNTPPKDVQEIVGHASYSTTVDIYGHLMPGAERTAAKKMDKFFGEISSTTA
jgi:integrase